VLVTAGVTTLALALIDFEVGARGRRRWRQPLVWLGTNALVIYAGSEVLRRLLDAAIVPQAVGLTTPKAWLFWGVLEPAFRSWPEAGSLLFAIGVLAMWIAVGAILYQVRGPSPELRVPSITVGRERPDQRRAR
jgi:predicted acyltransferase